MTFPLCCSVPAEESSIEVVEVLGQNHDAKILNSGFKVDQVLLEEFQNSTFDINDILSTTPGINIRETGGEGSNFDLSLNGLSGKQIRYFFDGIPMENFGSALGLNNFSANLAEKVNIYKGVVPVSLGADALGGAINVITSELNQDLIDISYSYGSFNTHKASVFAQKHTEKDVFIRVMSNVSHSDNNYKTYDVPYFDELGNLRAQIDVNRFHDQFTSGILYVKAGLINLAFADELSATVTLAGNKNNHQHPDKSINLVLGDYHTQNNTQLLSATYKKSWQHFSLISYALTGEITESFYDNQNRKYNWLGKYQIKDENTNRGELGEAPSIFHLTDKVVRGKIAGEYQLNSFDNVHFSLSSNYLKRSGEDDLNENNRSFSVPGWIRKNIVGLGYELGFLANSLQLNFFAKHYGFTGKITAENDEGIEVTTYIDTSKYGAGSTLSFQVTNDILLKASYEKAYRLPETDEILGTGSFVLPNAQLQPEQGNNYNLGLSIKHKTDSLLGGVESNVFHRNTKNYIRYDTDAVIYGTFINDQHVKTTGIETAFNLSFADYYSFAVNATYQEAINASRTDSNGVEHSHFNEQLPNQPNLFANTKFSIDGAAISLPQVNVFYSLFYVKEFYQYWENSGSKEHKHTIPTQITHDLNLEYSFDNDQVSLSLAVRNLFNEQVFDNYSIQKPGRAFYLKLRYTN